MFSMLPVNAFNFDKFRLFYHLVMDQTLLDRPSGSAKNTSFNKLHLDNKNNTNKYLILSTDAIIQVLRFLSPS